jgi:Leucine-rich repeat (LRR) protein
MFCDKIVIIIKSRGMCKICFKRLAADYTGMITLLVMILVSCSDDNSLETKIKVVSNVNRDVLDSNALNDIPDNVIKLVIRNNGFKTIAPGVFDRFTELQILDLSFNKIEKLSSEVFDSLSKLTELNLGNNRLKSLPSDIFKKLERLDGLTISRNQLTQSGLPSDLFTNNSNLMLLDIAINPLGSFPKGLFKNLKKLDYISAYETELESLGREDFIGLTNLKTLELNENKISKVELGTFTPLENIESLGLSMNYLKSVPKDLKGLTSLKSLFLADNVGLPYVVDAQIPEGIDNYDFQKKSELNSERRYEFIGNLTDVAQIDLIPANAKTIIIRDCNIITFPKHIFQKFSELEELDLGFNKIKFLPPGIFSNNLKLKRLYLAYNDLLTIPADLFNNLIQLEEVSLAGNKLTLGGIESSPDLFKGLRKLQQVHMEFNPLGGVDSEWFSDLEMLEYLGLFNNKIKELPAELFKNNLKLAEIDFAENYFESLPAEIFKSLPKNRKVILINNRLTELGICGVDRQGLILDSNPGIIPERYK